MNLYVVLKLSGANQLSISMSKLRLKSLTGFTLIELMVTAAVLIIAIVSTLTVFYSILGLNESSKNFITALSDGRTALERIRDTQPFTSVTVTALYPNNSALSGFSNLTSEQVVVSYADTSADPLDVTITISWQERGRTRSADIRTLMSGR